MFVSLLFSIEVPGHDGLLSLLICIAWLLSLCLNSFIMFLAEIVFEAVSLQFSTHFVLA